jgi:predicted membrane protein
MNEYNDRREERREERRQRWEEKRQRWEEKWEDRRKRWGTGGVGGRQHIWTGAFLLLIGAAALVKALVTDIPDWVFGWQTFLIVLGLFVGIRHRFRGGGWFILIVIGGLFLIRDVYPDLAIRRYIWPSIMILLGAFIILRPRRPWHEKKNAGIDPQPIPKEKETWSKDDFIDTTSIFGGTKKNILSKDFKGGDIVNIFGGTELNLSQADIQGKVSLEMTTIFGGTKLIVPPTWAIQSEAVTIFGGLEDKRSLTAAPENTDKVLLLRGTVLFGGIEIKSF